MTENSGLSEEGEDLAQSSEDPTGQTGNGAEDSQVVA